MANPVITPSDSTYLTHVLLLLTLSIGLTSTLIPHPDFPTVLRVAVTSVLSVCTFSFLNGHYSSLQHACALRLTHTSSSFRTAISGKTILSADGMGTIFKLISATCLLSNLPLLYIELMKGYVAGWVKKVEGPVSWWFAAVNVVVNGVCWAMVLTQEEMKVDFVQEVGEEVPLKAISIGKGGEWEKVGSTSRRHDVWVRKGEGEEWEMTTRLASNHPLYRAEKETVPSGPVLCIKL